MERIKPTIITSIDNHIVDELIKEEAYRAVRACYQCGRCTGGCPSGRRTALRTRQIIRKTLLGLDEVLADPDLWLCTTCFTCLERCPRSIPITEIIIKLRNLATQHGYLEPVLQKLTHVFINTGHGVPIGDYEGNWPKLREAYGLQKIPPTVHSHNEARDEVAKIMQLTKFDKLVGYGQEEKKDEKK